MKERVSIHPPPFPKQRQLGQTGKVKPGMACYGGGGGVRGSQATHHLSSVVNSIATIWRHNCHRRLRGSPLLRQHHRRRRRLPRTDGRQHHGDEIGRERGAVEVDTSYIRTNLAVRNSGLPLYQLLLKKLAVYIHLNLCDSRNIFKRKDHHAPQS